MGILGLAIQQIDGIPIFSKTWTDKLASFEKTDSMLTAGFMSAITSFADSFEQNIDFIQFNPKNNPASNGISAVINYFSEVMIICFTEPHLFLDKVNLKLQWIYNNIIDKKLHTLGRGKVFTLTKGEQAYIENILFDKLARIMIEEKKDQLISALEEIEKYFYHEEIKGFSINSFDNSIIFTYGIKSGELKNYLCNMGKGGFVKDWEVQYKPVWIGKNPILISYTNSAIKIPIFKIIGKDKRKSSEDSELYSRELPLYYYIITDPDCSIGPIMEKLNTTLHPLLVDYKFPYI